MRLRSYQQEAVDAVFDYWAKGGGSPLVDLATGLGKSVVVAEISKRARVMAPLIRSVMLVHVKELVKQNFLQLLRVWPDAPVGLYSAGLNKRDTHHPIIFGSIQSVFRKAEAFAPRHLVIIDEAHLVPKHDQGMYATFLSGLRANYPELRIVGLTATPYRMDSGRLTDGDDALFDDLVYEYGIGPATDDGWLCPLTARVGASEIDTHGVKKRGGEFLENALQKAAMAPDILESTCADLANRGQSRRSWLAFCTGIDHAKAVADIMRSKGISAACVTGKTKKYERDRTIEAFKRGEIRCLTNANVLTTGFDAPNVDLIAMLRPTLSTGLYVQMMGRGTRIKGVDVNVFETAAERCAAIEASEKPNCLVLDYAGNVRRHGPVDSIFVEDKEPGGPAEREDDGKVEEDDIRAKVCPECEALVAKNASRCRECGHEFGPPKHADTPEDVAILSREAALIYTPVRSWHAYAWHKAGDPNAVPTLRVDYVVGLQNVAEWIPFEHERARGLAAKWWKEHGGDLPVPETVVEAAQRFHELTPPVEVNLMREGKFMRINKRRHAHELEGVSE